MPGSERIFGNDETDPLDGKVRWCASKSLWIGTMTFLAITLGPIFLTSRLLFFFFPLFFLLDTPSVCIGA